MEATEDVNSTAGTAAAKARRHENAQGGSHSSSCWSRFSTIC